MNVTLEYFGPLRQAAGVAAETIALPEGGTAQDAVTAAAEKYGGAFRLLTLRAADTLRPSLLVTVNDEPIAKSHPHVLRDGDRIRLLAAIAGG